MGPDVLLKVGELGELALADLAPVGLDAQVDPHVLGEVGAVGEGLAALAALVRLGFPHVHLCVQLQVGFGSKHLQVEARVSFAGFSVLVRHYGAVFSKLVGQAMIYELGAGN